MGTELYDSMRHFADSWGLVYMFTVFVAVVLFLLRPGARDCALDAAMIPLRDNEAAPENDRP